MRLFLASQSEATSPTLHAIIEGVTGHQGAPMEIRREDKRLGFQPLHDCQCLRLLCHVITFKGIREVSVQVITVEIFPLKERIFFLIGECGSRCFPDVNTSAMDD